MRCNTPDAMWREQQSAMCDTNITTGGYTFIGMSGNEGRPGVTAPWLPMLQQIVPPPEWATIDLFAKFHPVHHV